jgi:multiple antibiotic resistance protein
MQQHLQAIVTVLSLVNPLICGAMFAQIEAGATSATRLADATKAAVAVLVILVFAALVEPECCKFSASRWKPFRLPAEVC